MSSKTARVVRAALAGAGLLSVVGVGLTLASRVEAQQPASAPAADRRFYADDPVWRDDDMRHIEPVPLFDLSKSYEFVHETFGQTVQSWGPALNVNTLGEVPD